MVRTTIGAMNFLWHYVPINYAKINGLTKSRPHDCTTAQRPHSLEDCAARLHALRTCLIMTAHR